MSLQESRAEQIARIRRKGLRLDDLERELVKAEQRGASVTKVAPRPLQQEPRPPRPLRPEPTPALPLRILKHLRAHDGTALEIAHALRAGEKQTHRAVNRLLAIGSIRVVRTIDSQAHVGRTVRVFGSGAHQ